MDLSQMSDAELMKIAGMGGGAGPVGGTVPLSKNKQILDVFSPDSAAPDLSQHSDEELMRIAGLMQGPANLPRTPESMADDMLRPAVRKPPTPLAPVNNREGGYIDRMAGNIETRKNQMQTIADQYVNNGISGLEANLRMGVKYAQLLPDAINEGVVSSFRALPDAVETPIRQGASDVYTAVANSPVGDAARYALNKYQDFEQNHPVAAGRINSALDVGNLAAGFVPLKGKSVVDTAGTAVVDASKVGGGLAKDALAVAGRALTPTIQEGMRPVVALAEKYKIPVALHQVTEGNAIKNIQKVSKELPFSGEAKFRDAQMSAFNRELIKTTGGRANKFTPELMDNLFTKVGKEFDDFGKGKIVNLNDKFAQSTEDLILELKEIAPETVNPAMARIQKIYSMADENGHITGEKLASLRKETNRLARKTNNPDIASAFQDIENALIDSITVGDEHAAKAFSATKQKYKNLLVLEPLAQKAKGGNISPTLLQNRVSKIYGRSFTRGQAGEIGDLARIGHELLPELGGSDTLQKGAYLVGGGGVIANPASVPFVAGGLGINRAFQSGVNRNQKIVSAALNKSRIKSSKGNPPSKIVGAQ